MVIAFLLPVRATTDVVEQQPHGSRGKSVRRGQASETVEPCGATGLIYNMFSTEIASRADLR